MVSLTVQADKSLQMPALIYSNMRGSAAQAAYEAKYADGLVPTPDLTFYQVLEGLQGYRMSTASEELAIQLAIKATGQDPRQAAVFGDLFARGPSKKYMWQWVLTGLRVPEGVDPEKTYRELIDGVFHDVYPRIVLIGSEEKGEALVPQGDGRIVTSWNPVYGIARTTTGEEIPYDKHTSHWYFNNKPQNDPVSGKKDVAVIRDGGWLPGGHGRCLVVNADAGRWDSASNDGFRPVEGALVHPEYESKIVDVEALQVALFGQVAKDLRELTLPQLLEKYKSE